MVGYRALYPIKATCVQSHQRQPRSAVAIVTCEVQVSGAQRTFRPRLGRHGRREILSMFKTIAQMSPMRSVAHRLPLWPTNSIASTERSIWQPLCLGDHGNLWTTMTMVLPPLCLLCTTCCVTTAVLVVQWTPKGRAAAVTQKQNFLGLGDHWTSWSIFWSPKGGTKVAALCKGGLTDVQGSNKVKVFHPKQRLY